MADSGGTTPLPGGVVREAIAPEQLVIVWADQPVSGLLDALADAGPGRGALRVGLSEVVDPNEEDAVRALMDSAVGSGSSERVLAVGAYPDDVEIGCGATLLRHRTLGHPVSVLTLSGVAKLWGPRSPCRPSC